MTTPKPIETLFANDIHRSIEEVIKVDQTSPEILREEIDEYVVTRSICQHYTGIFDRYLETPNKPHESIAVWVSGFFGSGKSSFAKILGLAIEDRPIPGGTAGRRFAERAGDPRLDVLLRQINERVPTHAVIFDVSTDRGIRSGNQTLTEIMYGRLLQSLDYAKDLDLSEMEITLEERGRLDAFKAEYRRIHKKDWDGEKGKISFAISEASQVMHSLEPETYPFADSWSKAIKNKADISPGKLAERATELMARRGNGKYLLFVIDEVGQFAARDVQKMLDLQAIVQNLAIKGRGKHWIVVTSQERLNEIVSGLDDKKIELARLMDRFPHQVHLETSDISEVTSRRVLSKNAAAQAELGKLFDDHCYRFGGHVRLDSPHIKLPDLTRDSFIDLYPLLPYQIELIIQVVSGLRGPAGSGRHVGGANRTIIKLAQQLLINPAVNLASAPIGTLVRLDQVYDLVEGNIDSDVRAKITGISKELSHPLAQRVAKVICLLQYMKTVDRTPENIAAALHPAVSADSELAGVKEALRELTGAHKVRLGDGGYRIPTPAEDNWERLRDGISPKPGDYNRLYSEVIETFWQPQPSHLLLETKTFKAGLAISGREVTAGDMMFQLYLEEDGNDFETLTADLRARSQKEKKQVFWAVPLSDAIDREAREAFRSKELLARKERDAGSRDTPGLVHEERVRGKRHGDELRRLLKAACLSGRVFFRGNDRSPGDRAADVGKTASEILAQVLPEVFDRFKEAAARSADVKRGTDALFTAENLKGLPPVFAALALLRDEKGKTVFRAEGVPLKEVMERIEERTNYGDTASGRYLTDELGKEPFGWDFEVVRLLVLSLLRAGKIEATSKGQTVDTVTTVEARETFSNNNLFRQASFRPKKGVEFEELIKASEAFRETFGSDVRELNAGAIATELRKEVARHEDEIAGALHTLTVNRLPGAAVLETALGQMKAVLRDSEDNAISTFNASHRSVKAAIKRAAEVEQTVTDARIHDLERARRAARTLWPFLQSEGDVDPELHKQASLLSDLLARETFYKEQPAIEQATRAIETEHGRRYEEALSARVTAYTKAFDRLVATPGWTEIDEDQQRRLAEPFEYGKKADDRVPIAQLRSERDACDGRLRAAQAELRRIIDGERVVSVNLSAYFSGGIETEEQLDAALEGVRDECARLLGAGKKVIVQ